MFGIFTGVFINAGLVVLGGLAGTLFKTEKLQRIGDRIFQAFAIFVMVLGISGSINLSQPIAILVSLAIGVGIGEIADIDKQFNRFGYWLQFKLTKDADPENNAFAQGFINASLLFCIGSMTFLGALESGIQNVHTTYIAKGVIDCVSGITLAMGSGIGVCFSAISVIVYQGLLVVFASVLSGVLTAEVITLCSTIGSLFLVAIGLNMLGLAKIKVANFLPAMFMPMIWQALTLLFSL